MQWNSRWVCALLTGCVVTLAGTAAQQRSTSTEVKKFEIVAVDGNRVVVKDATGAKEITVPPDFSLSVDGKPVTVADLKPGMKGSARITTTTTVTPVHVTEVRNAEVVQASANSILVKGQNGFRNFTESEIEKRGITIVKDGRPAKFTDFHQGDKITATIVTTGTPKVMTERQVQASLGSPSQPAAPKSAATTGAAPAGQSARAESSSGAPPVAARRTPGAAAPSSAAAAPSSAAAAPASRLPKTASPLPLVGLFGALSLALAVILTIRRYRAI